MHKKPFLPEKICLVCSRPFAWRKKWERDWEQVKYCSEKCKKNKDGDIQSRNKTASKNG